LLKRKCGGGDPHAMFFNALEDELYLYKIISLIDKSR